MWSMAASAAGGVGGTYSDLLAELLRGGSGQGGAAELARWERGLWALSALLPRICLPRSLRLLPALGATVGALLRPLGEAAPGGAALMPRGVGAARARLECRALRLLAAVAAGSWVRFGPHAGGCVAAALRCAAHHAAALAALAAAESARADFRAAAAGGKGCRAAMPPAPTAASNPSFGANALDAFARGLLALGGGTNSSATATTEAAPPDDESERHRRRRLRARVRAHVRVLCEVADACVTMVRAGAAAAAAVAAAEHQPAEGDGGSDTGGASQTTAVRMLRASAAASPVLLLRGLAEYVLEEQQEKEKAGGEK